MKNRKLLAVLSMILAVCMALSACGSSDTTTAAPENTTAAGGSDTTAAADSGDYADRELKAAYSGIADSMDPFLCMNSIACNICTEQVYSSLLKRDENHAIVYNLADSYTVNEDGTEYNFHIRDDATFGNGDKILASDCAFSIKSAAASSMRAHYFAALEDAVAVDESNLKVTLKYNDPCFLARVAAPGTTSIVSESFYNSCNGEYGTSVDKIISSGPYNVTAWEYNVSMSFEAREDFWGETSNIKKAKIFNITDTNGLMVAMQTGDIDLSWSPASGSTYDTLKAAEGVHFTEYKGARYENVHMYYKSGTFADVRMRKAVAYAINSEDALTVGVDGMGFTTRYPGDNTATNCNPDYDTPNRITYNVEEGKKLVEECGNVGLHVVINSYQPDPYPALSTWLQSALNAIGLDAEVQVMERGAWIDACNAEEMEIGILSLVGSVFDMDDDFCNYVASDHCGSGGNYGWYVSEEMDKLIAESRTKVDPAERTESYKAMIDLFWEDVPMVPLFCWNYALPTADTLNVPNGRLYRFSSYSWIQ